jgi:uncharacterized membrane protein YcjF (UPF0283 family)
MTNQGEVYAQFVAAELEHERKRRERLDTRATATIAASAALVGLAVAIGIFDPASLSKQRPAVLGWAFLVGALLILVSAVLAMWAGWLRPYDVLARQRVRQLLSDPDWGDTPVDARGKVAQANAQTLDTLRSGNNKKAIKLLISHACQLAGISLLLAVALAAAVWSIL